MKPERPVRWSDTYGPAMRQQIAINVIRRKLDVLAEAAERLAEIEAQVAARKRQRGRGAR